MKRFSIAIGLIAVSTLASADTMMKPGLWEMRLEKQIMDGRDMAAEMAAMQAEMQKRMAAMPPEQRKQMEQVMGGRGMGPAGGGSPNVHRVCISPEMAAQDKPVAHPDSKCQPTKYQRIGDRVVFEMNCPNMVGKGETVFSGDSMASKMDMTMTDANGKHVMHSESRMKYLGSDCQGIKPADQIAKEMQNRMKR